MKKLLAVLLSALMLTGCAALPGEERSFAVVLGLDCREEKWQAGVRIPTYQSGGGYATLTAEGASLGEALARLNASAPMELHYGQLRLLVLSNEVAETEPLQELLHALAERGEVRPQALVCVTEERMQALLDAMKPSTGSRLSKSVEAMAQARQAQGAAPEATLSSVLRMGERQQPVLLNAGLENGALKLSGGWLTDGKIIREKLTETETQLLSLMQGRLKQGTLALEGDTLTLLNADCVIRLEGGTARCRVKLRYGSSTLTEEGVSRAVEEALREVTGKLASAGCDALGVGRQAMMACATVHEWNGMNWQEQYPTLTWVFEISPEKEA